MADGFAMLEASIVALEERSRLQVTQDTSPALLHSAASLLLAVRLTINDIPRRTWVIRLRVAAFCSREGLRAVGSTRLTPRFDYACRWFPTSSSQCIVLRDRRLDRLQGRSPLMRISALAVPCYLFVVVLDGTFIYPIEASWQLGRRLAFGSGLLRTSAGRTPACSRCGLRRTAACDRSRCAERQVRPRGQVNCVPGSNLALDGTIGTFILWSAGSLHAARQLAAAPWATSPTFPGSVATPTWRGRGAVAPPS